MNCIIWDLDNCLADDRHRIPLIDRSAVGVARWDAYHAACANDPPGRTDVLAAVRRLAPWCAEVFLTGRPESQRQATRSWLDATCPTPADTHSLLLMRPDGDARDALAIKGTYLAYLRTINLNPLLAFDDRPDIVEMYRDRGVPGVVLAVHADASPHEQAPQPDVGAISAGSAEDWADVDSLAQLRCGRASATAAGFREVSFAVDDILTDAARTFAARNATYGVAYKGFGAVLAAAWPAGLRVEGEEQFGRLALMVMGLGKWHRYARSFSTGHIDSARDAVVYAAMLEQLTRQAHGEPVEVKRG